MSGEKTHCVHDTQSIVHVQYYNYPVSYVVYFSISHFVYELPFSTLFSLCHKISDPQFYHSSIIYNLTFDNAKIIDFIGIRAISGTQIQDEKNTIVSAFRHNVSNI